MLSSSSYCSRLFMDDPHASPVPQSPSVIYSSKNAPLRIRLDKDLELPQDVDLSVIESSSVLSPTSSTPSEGNWMDQKRKNLSGYEYLCRLEAAKQWLQEFADEPLPPASQLGESLRNGVILARVVQRYSPELVKKIFDAPKLQFRHSDNINYFFVFLRKMGLPDVCMFELTDLYDLKNIPKVIYSLHAISHVIHLRRLGPGMKNLLGKVEFTEEEVNAMQADLDEAGLLLPSFAEVEQIMESEGIEFENEPSLDSGAEVISPMTPPQDELAHYKEHLSDVIVCQKQVRMQLARRKYLQQRQYYFQHLTPITKLQAYTRGYLVRKKVKAQREFYAKNKDSIIAIQSWLKTKVQSSAYHSLMNHQHCTIPVISKFLHLLDTDDDDTSMEIEVEQLKEKVVKQIRENAQLEAEVSELDIKIGLLVKNQNMLEELIKVSNKRKLAAAHLLSPEDKSPDSEASFSAANLFQLDRASRARLENYQNLFYLLQTQPKYLTKLLWAIRESANDAAKKRLETSILTLFSYAQNAREEYLLLNLFNSIIQLEMEQVASLKEFMNGDPSFFKLVVQYVRGAKERQYLQSTLSSSVARITECEDDLDTNYVTVYKTLIKEEESSTGQRSSKTYDVSMEVAKEDSNTCARVQHNRVLLQGFVKSVLGDILKSLGQLPYGIRYISKLLYRTLQTRFPDEPEEFILKNVANLIYYRYVNPALVSPDAFSVTTHVISPLARKNLTEVSKILYWICCGKEVQNSQEFDADFIASSSSSYIDFIKQAMKVPEPEIQLRYDAFKDASQTRNPIIYISVTEIFSVHELLCHYKDIICKNAPEDPMFKCLEALGAPPTVSQGSNGNEIALTLTPMYTVSNLQENYELRRLFYCVKKEIIKLIRVYKYEKDLVTMIESPTTEKEEALYQIHKSSLLPVYNSLHTLAGGTDKDTLQEVKDYVKKSLPRLESGNFVSSQDKYQSILDSIALDIRTRHERRDTLRTEKGNLESTLTSLLEKNEYLVEQEKSYMEIVDACLQQLSSHSSSQSKWRRPFFPFSKQARHLRRVEKETGMVPKFGSYIYSAKELLEKGIITWIDPDRLPNGFMDKLKITLSSNTAGVFDVTASFGIQSGIKSVDQRFSINEQDSIKLDELLSLQFENRPEISLFENTVKANVNLLIFFVNKKFYA